MTRRGRICWGLLVSTLLVACSPSPDEELRAWMSEQRAQIHPKVTPIPEPKPFQPQAYVKASEFEPFNRDKLTQALKKDSAQSPVDTKLIAPELVRRKEALEAYPLDVMTMVGSMVQSGKPVALIKVDNLLYQVKPGQYLGQNFGRVMRVTETQVVLREIVQDAVGEWIERPATLQLQERTP